MQNKFQKDKIETQNNKITSSSLFKWFWNKDIEEIETSWFFNNEMKSQQNHIDKITRETETHLTSISRYFKH